MARIQKLEDTPSKMIREDLELFKKFRFVFEKNKFTVPPKEIDLRMQLGQKDRFVLGIFFSGRYIREMEKIFLSEQVPMELTRFPLLKVHLISMRIPMWGPVGFGSLCAPRENYINLKVILLKICVMTL